jgi:hypothetical protein
MKHLNPIRIVLYVSLLNDPSHDHDIMRSPGVWSPEMENI